MKISEVIEELASLKKVYGDLEVIMYDTFEAGTPDYSMHPIKIGTAMFIHRNKDDSEELMSVTTTDAPNTYLGVHLY